MNTVSDLVFKQFSEWVNVAYHQGKCVRGFYSQGGEEIPLFSFDKARHLKDLFGENPLYKPDKVEPKVVHFRCGDKTFYLEKAEYPKDKWGNTGLIKTGVKCKDNFWQVASYLGEDKKDFRKIKAIAMRHKMNLSDDWCYQFLMWCEFNTKAVSSVGEEIWVKGKPQSWVIWTSNLHEHSPKWRQYLEDWRSYWLEVG